MRRWLRVTPIEVLVVLGIFAAFVVPVTPWGNIYFPVSADVDYWRARDGVTTEAWFGAPDHLVQDGQLFLRVQSTRHALVLVTEVDAPHWDEQSVASYRADHPELDDLWPDQPIRWLRR